MNGEFLQPSKLLPTGNTPLISTPLFMPLKMFGYLLTTDFTNEHFGR